MKFYIASKLENADNVRKLAKQLESEGWRQTYDWTLHGSVKATNEETLNEVSKKKFKGIKDADILIIMTPEGRGVHVELGMAVALGKLVIIHHTDNTFFKCDDNTCLFYWSDRVIHEVSEVDDLAGFVWTISWMYK